MTMRECHECGGQVSSEAESCPHCGSPADNHPAAGRGPKGAVPKSPKSKVKLGLGLAGVALLVVGCFLPILSMGGTESINLYKNGEGDGVIVIGVAMLALLLMLLKKYRGVMLTGLASGGIVGYDFLNVSSKVSDAEALGLGQLIQLQWGWAVLIVGAVLLIVAAVKR